MAKVLFAIIFLSLAALAVFYLYIIPKPSSVPGFPENPIVITRQAFISESGYYILSGDISCANLSTEEACISFGGKIDNFLLDCRGHSITGKVIMRDNRSRALLANGIEIHLDAHGTLKNCVVQGFGISGILLHHSSGNTITNNTLLDNQIGIYNDGSPNNSITNNIAINNTYGIYVFLEESSNVLVANNTANDNAEGIYFFDSPLNGIITGNTANNNRNYGIWLNLAYNITVAGNRLCGNPKGSMLCENSTVIDNGGNICEEGTISCGGMGIRCADGCR